MTTPNFNADDPNNPLLQRLQGRSPYGTAGAFQPFDIQPGGQSQHASMIGANGFNPEFWEQYIEAGSEGGGGETRWRPKQSTKDKLKGRVQMFRPNVGGPGGAKDPDLVDVDDTFGLLTDPSNLNAVEDNMGMFNLILALGGGGMASAIAGNMAAAGAAGGAAGGGTGAMSGLNIEMLPNLTQPAMGTMVPAATAEGVGGLGALGSAASGGGGAGGLSIEMLPNIAQPAMNSMVPAATATGSGGLVSALGGYGNIARGAMGLASLGSSSSGGGSRGGGGASDASSIIDQMANVNRVDHDTPLGSRRWTQGPDGRWSVNDSMDPAEEANFRQVQGMNADVTGMARQRLAALLAGPSRQRADRPLNVAGFPRIGG
jgi:hypothetical protein